MKKCTIEADSRQLKCEDGTNVSFDDLKKNECELDKNTRRVKCKNGSEFQL